MFAGLEGGGGVLFMVFEGEEVEDEVDFGVLEDGGRGCCCFEGRVGLLDAAQGVGVGGVESVEGEVGAEGGACQGWEVGGFDGGRCA